MREHAVPALFLGLRLEALRESRTTSVPLALLLLDLNRFKEVNDTLGRPVNLDGLTTHAQASVGHRLQPGAREPAR